MISINYPHDLTNQIELIKNKSKVVSILMQKYWFEFNVCELSVDFVPVLCIFKQQSDINIIQILQLTHPSPMTEYFRLFQPHFIAIFLINLIVNFHNFLPPFIKIQKRVRSTSLYSWFPFCFSFHLFAF